MAMVRPHRLLHLALPAVLAVVACLGCDRGGVSAPYIIDPGSVEITGPEDGGFVNLQLIDVRGRAELGTLVYVYVDGVFAGGGNAFQTEPPQELGTFRVEDVDLGTEETEKTIVAVAADDDGNTADHGDTVRVVLDLTPPPADLERLEGAQQIEPDAWVADGPWVDAYGRTDTTAIIVRIRGDGQEFLPEEYDVFPGEPGEPDSVRVRFRITSPRPGSLRADLERTYDFQTIDAADNYTQTFFTVRWTTPPSDCQDSGDAAAIVLREIVGSDTLEREVRLRPLIVAAGDTVRSMGGFQEFVARADSWLFCIDDQCGAHWKHDCRYVFVAVADCLYDVIEAYWPPDDWADMVSIASWGCP